MKSFAIYPIFTFSTVLWLTYSSSAALSSSPYELPEYDSDAGVIEILEPLKLYPKHADRLTRNLKVTGGGAGSFNINGGGSFNNNNGGSFNNNNNNGGSFNNNNGGSFNNNNGGSFNNNNGGSFNTNNNGGSFNNNNGGSFNNNVGGSFNTNYGVVQSGVGCGYLRMRPGQVVTVQSSNFRNGEYYNNEACIWKFFGHHCSLSAQCPCADIPQSHSCIEDYLKISDTFLFNQRFCGDIRPEGTYESATNNLKIRFRSDHKETAAGFLCFVSCRAPGAPYFILPNNITCPTSGYYTGVTGIPTTATPDANYTGEVIIPPVTPPQGKR